MSAHNNNNNNKINNKNNNISSCPNNNKAHANFTRYAIILISWKLLYWCFNDNYLKVLNYYLTNIGLIFKHWPLITVQRSCKVCGDYMTGTACDTRSIYFGSTSVCEGGKDFCMTDLIHDSSGSDKIFKRCFCLLPLLRANSFTTYSRIVLVYSKKYL